jgi:hypothetical protein
VILQAATKVAEAYEYTAFKFRKAVIMFLCNVGSHQWDYSVLKSRRTDLHYREELIADIYLLNYYKGQ